MPKRRELREIVDGGVVAGQVALVGHQRKARVDDVQMTVEYLHRLRPPRSIRAL